MKKSAFLLIVIFIVSFGLLSVFNCTGRGGSEDDEDLAPFLFQESFEIWPAPAELYEDATFYFGWEDHDGDMENPTIIVYLVNEAGDNITLDAENIEVDSDSDTAGSLSFTVRIMDGYQGDYNILVEDEMGNQSNNISRFLYVNTEPPEDQE